MTKLFEFPDLWSESDVTARLREIPDVAAGRARRRETRRVRRHSSGQTLLYDSAGQLVFAGGITAFPRPRGAERRRRDVEADRGRFNGGAGGQRKGPAVRSR